MSKLITVKIDQITEGKNIRRDLGSTEALSRSIQAQGLEQPLKAYKDGDTYVLWSGFRRLQALRDAGATEVEIILTEPFQDDLDRILHQVAGNEGQKPLSPMEEADVIQQIMDLKPGITKEDISRMTGWSSQKISQRMQLQGLVASLKRLVHVGQLSVAAALELARLTPDQQLSSVEFARQNPSLASAKQWVDAIQNAEKIAQSTKIDLDLDDEDLAKQIMANIEEVLTDESVSVDSSPNGEATTAQAPVMTQEEDAAEAIAKDLMTAAYSQAEEDAKASEIAASLAASMTAVLSLQQIHMQLKLWIEQNQEYVPQVGVQKTLQEIIQDAQDALLPQDQWQELDVQLPTSKADDDLEEELDEF